jgi:hypothetical protein
VDRNRGNGLALKSVGETIRQVYVGDVGAVLSDALPGHGVVVFGGVRRRLDVQMERLSSVEQEVLRQLAVEREPLSLAELARDLAWSRSRGMVVEAVETLRRRSLVERGDRASFTLQSLVLEYVTDRLVQGLVEEIGRNELRLPVGAPMIRAHASD